MRHICCALALLGFAVACRTAPPTQYYTLNMHSSGRAIAPVNLVVERIEVGEALSRRDIMIKQSPTEIEYYASDQWAAGLDELVARKLQEEFGHPQTGRRTLLLQGTVLAFEQIDVPGGADAFARLAVEVRGEGGSRHDPPLMSRVYQAQSAAGSTQPKDVALALSHVLEQMAQEIVADVQAL